MWRRRQRNRSATDTPRATVTFVAASTPAESDTFFVTQALSATDMAQVTDDLGPTDTSEAAGAPHGTEVAGTADTSEPSSNSTTFSRFRTRSKTRSAPNATDMAQVTDDLGPTDTSEAAGAPHGTEVAGTADTSEPSSNSTTFSRFRARSKTRSAPNATDMAQVTDDLGPTDTSEAAGAPHGTEVAGTADTSEPSSNSTTFSRFRTRSKTRSAPNATDMAQVTDDLGPTDTSEAAGAPHGTEVAGTADTSEPSSNSTTFSRFRARSKTRSAPNATDMAQVTDDLGPTDTSEAAGAPIDHRIKGQVPNGPRLQRRGMARALLSLFLVVGMATAVVVGWQSKSAAARQSHQSFNAQASGIVANVTKTLQRDTDLTTSMRAEVEQDPAMTNKSLESWFSALTPAGLANATGVAYIEKLSPLEYYYFRAAINSDPTGPASAGEPFVITPSSAQPPYCLTRLLALRSSRQGAGDLALPSGLDWCSTSVNGALTSSGNTGQLEVTRMLGPDEGRALGFQAQDGGAPGNSDIETLKTLDQAFGSTVVVLAPVYEGPTPTTVAGRVDALEGWVGGIFDTREVLAGAVGAHSDLQVTLARVNAGSGPEVLATTDTANSSGGLVDTIPTAADGRWIVTVRLPLSSGSASGTTRGLAVGSAILLVTLILFFVLRSLVVSRRRALDEAAEQTDELHHMALHDVLTGLPNRSLVMDRADQMLVRSRRSQLPIAALAVGVDRFKECNDAHGYQTGDELLQAVADRLRSVLREGDTLGRVRGDEFTVLVDGASLAAGPELVAERILEVVRKPFYLGEGHLEPYRVSASVGIALGPRIDAEHLLQDADTALSEAKEAGRDRYAVFGQDIPQAIESRQAFENELRSAMVQHQFFLRYQPIFDIDTRSTTGVEALLRWQHPTRGVIPPDHFLPMLEESGLIVALGRWVLQEACRQGAALHRSGHLITMSVNMSARQLESDTLVADVGRVLYTSGFDPHALVLEITETTIMRDTSLMVDRLIALKGLGVRIAIDDFGTGYSSLAYLRQFPIDVLKIDRSFISSLATTRDSSMLIHTLVQFGKTLGLETIAEGIEEEGQIDPLLAEQCDTGQGFLYGRPLSPAQLDIFLCTHLTQEAPLWVVPSKQAART